jgi:predicted membrane-bound spermidine synthase
MIKKYYMLFTLFMTGASVMVLELAGTRVIAPVYGSGLFVWASLITVTLTCLAIGYWIGGKMADKRPQARVFYLIILATGIVVAPLCIVSRPVLAWSIGLGFRAGPLASAYVLFTIPMILLGMISPYAVRLVTDRLNVLGTTAGRLYAISTMGSFAGTLVTGFVLIPTMGTRNILFLLSIMLIALWIGYYLVDRKYSAGALSALFLVIPAGLFTATLLPHPESAGLLTAYKSESLYGQLKVLEEGAERTLYVDNIKQSSMHRDTYLPSSKVYYCFEMLPLYNKEGKEACLIGLAGANIPRRLWEYGIRTDCVDIEPRMEHVARTYFGFLDRFGTIHIDDGRVFIKRSDKQYDFIIIDVFTGDDIPFHLITEESFGEIKEKLTENGVLGINFIGEVYGTHSLGWKSVYKTLSQVFPHVKAYSFLKGSELVDTTSNVIFFASDAELSVPEGYRETCTHPMARYIIERLLQCELESDGREGMVLTDDYSPIEFLRKGVAEKIRRKQVMKQPERYFLD